MIRLCLFVYLVRLSLQTCPLEKSAVPASNVGFDGNPFDSANLAIMDETAFTVKCADSKHVFINAVRATDDVNITSLDEGGTIKGLCTVNNMIPNIFTSTRVENTYNSGTRKFYCARGCNPLKAAGQKIWYPGSMLGNEANSPPVTISDKIVLVSCASKYAQVVGDNGYTSIQCKTGGTSGWTHGIDKLIKCVNGCPDVRNISNGYTRAELTGEALHLDAPPFTIGDILPFDCNPGYILVGFSTLTCTSDYMWHENVPECVLVTGSSSVPVVPATSWFSFFIIVWYI